MYKCIMTCSCIEPSGPPLMFSGTSGKDYITLTWDLPAPDKQNGKIIGFSINITSDDQNYINFSILVTRHSRKHSFGNLDPNTKYHCFIAAKTNIGIGPYTGMSLETLEDGKYMYCIIVNIVSLVAPVSAPNITFIQALDSSTVVIRWIPPVEESRNGQIRYYQIRIVINATERLVYENTTVAVLVSLIPSYTYAFSVAAVTVSVGPFSNTIEITMPEDGRQKLKTLSY